VRRKISSSGCKVFDPIPGFIRGFRLPIRPASSSRMILRVVVGDINAAAAQYSPRTPP
jgi:hypothetical protein